MSRRENAILLGIGTTRRKFHATNSNPVETYVEIPAMKYVANASGKLCKGFVNHKCLFNKGDTLEILCPETVMEDGHATFFIHRAWNGKDMLMQRYLNDYISLLEFKEECVLKFKVTQIGHFSFSRYEECVCIQPVPGTNLWIDKRLTLQPERIENHEPEKEKITDPKLPTDNEFYFSNELDDVLGYDCDSPSFFVNDDGFI